MWKHHWETEKIQGERVSRLAWQSFSIWRVRGVCKFFGSPPTNRWGLYLNTLHLSRLCDQQNRVEVMLLRSQRFMLLGSLNPLRTQPSQKVWQPRDHYAGRVMWNLFRPAVPSLPTMPPGCQTWEWSHLVPLASPSAHWIPLDDFSRCHMEQKMNPAEPGPGSWPRKSWAYNEMVAFFSLSHQVWE